MATAAIVAAALVAVAVLAVLYADRQRQFAIAQAKATKEKTGLATELGKERESLRNSLAESNRLLAIRNFDRGQAAFEKDQIGPGLLWMIQSWRSAVDAGDLARQHVARANLAAWQPYHHRLKAVLSHPRPVDAAAFSPDGKLVVTGSDDRTAQLWDAATAQPIGPPLRHGGEEVISVAFSPDGEIIFTGSQDGTARLWKAATGQPIGHTFRHKGGVISVVFSPDGKTFRTGSEDGEARLWDAASGQPIGPPLQHQAKFWAVAFSPDGKTVLTGDNDGEARLWDAASGRPIGPPMRHEIHVRAVAFSPDGKTIVTGGQDSTAQLWDAATGQPIGPPLKRHRDRVRAVAFSTDGKTVLTGSTDKTAQLWDAATGSPIGRPLQHQGPVVAVAFSSDGTTMLTVSSDGTVKLWDARLYNPVTSVLEHPTWAFYRAFSPDGRTILTVCGDEPSREGEGAESMISEVYDTGGILDISLVSKRILTRTRDGVARLWNGATGQPIGPPLDVVATGDSRLVAFSPDGRTVLILSPDNKARFWDAASATPLGKPFPQPGQVGHVTFSPNSKTFLTGHGTGMVQMWDVATRGPLGEPIPHPGSVDSLAFSPDGTSFLTGCEDGGARLWDVATQQPRIPPFLHPNWVWSVDFSPDGKTIVTGCDDAAARLWDAATGMPLGPTLVSSKYSVMDVAFSRDGKGLFTESDAVRRLQITLELPDELERVATWVEVLTGLSLDPKQGSIYVLDNAAWLEHRARLEHLGGPPETAADQGLDPIRCGANPTARARAWMHQRRWSEAEAEFEEVVRERPHDPRTWWELHGFWLARSQPEKAAAELERAVKRMPNHPFLHHQLAIARLLTGDLPGYHAACSEMLKRYGTVEDAVAANLVADACIYAPDVVRDLPALIRVAQRSVPAQAGGERIVGAVLYRAGRYEEALKSFEQSYNVFKPRARDCLFLAMIHSRLGHADPARRLLKQADQWIAEADRAPPGTGTSGHQPKWSSVVDSYTTRLLRREAEAEINLSPVSPPIRSRVDDEPKLRSSRALMIETGRPQ
jgi:WD40 repeat protein